jgi:hypothetical protein
VATNFKNISIPGGHLWCLPGKRGDAALSRVALKKKEKIL